MNTCKLILFDLDGTLCKSRKPVTAKLITLLSKVSEYVEIGILKIGVRILNENRFIALS